MNARVFQKLPLLMFPISEIEKTPHIRANTVIKNIRTRVIARHILRTRQLRDFGGAQ